MENEKTVSNEENKNEAKKSFLSDAKIEIITVVLLGITALLTAWASYVGSIHGGNQATNYALSNNLSNDGKNDTEDILAWLDDENGNALNSPFADEAFVQKYFEESEAKLDEAEKVMEQGRQDNANGDKFSLVTVVYSVALFLLGIVGVFKNKTNKKVVLAISVVCLLVAVIFMVTIPLPTSGGIFG